MENLLPILIQAISGAVGGNAAGALKKDISLGTLGNSIAGIVGGPLGGLLLGLLGVNTGGAGTMDLGIIVGSIAGGGVGGGILMAIVGWVKQALVKK